MSLSMRRLSCRIRQYRPLAAGPKHSSFNDGPNIRILENFHAMTGGAHENAALAPLARPDGGRSDGTRPRIPLADCLRRGRQYIDVTVVEHPVLLGDQVEILNTPGNRMLRGGRQHVDAIWHVVVGLLADALVRVLARVTGELTTDQVQVVRGIAVRISDPTVPAGHTGAGPDGCVKTLQRLAVDRRHRVALDDQIHRPHKVWVRVDFR